MKSVLVCGFWVLAGAALAQSDGIASVGVLSDDELYRSMTCGAAPGAACTGPIVRWGKSELTVAFVDETTGMPGKTALIRTSLDLAIETLNQAGANLHLTLADDTRPADITLHHLDMAEGDVTQNTPGFPDGLTIGTGHMWLSWDDALHIQAASILITSQIEAEQARSVVLEELTQSLGFLFDIENPYYEGVSILSQDSNETISIAGQDRAMLRMHYPFE